MAKTSGRTRGQGDVDEVAAGGEATPADTAQKGGSRGSSNKTGPSRDNTRNSRAAIAGSDQPEQGANRAGGSDDPIRGPLPPGATREDYVGGAKPHKTREAETKTGTRERAGRKRNEVM